jgi:hypothetical protein
MTRLCFRTPLFLYDAQTSPSVLPSSKQASQVGEYDLRTVSSGNPLCAAQGFPVTCIHPYKFFPKVKLHMETRFELHEITIGSLFAETLEREAKLMPAGHRLEAHLLRRQAAYYAMMFTKTIRVWREVPVEQTL